VAIEVTMPQMGADMTEGTLLRWLKDVGDSVERGDILAEIETDKATIELEAYESGTLIKRVAGEGDIIPVGDVIALLGDASEAVPDVERKPPAETPARRTVEPEAKKAVEPAPAPTAAPAQEPGDRVRISPVARKMASEAGIDPSALRGSGPDGRILRRDIEAAMAAAGPGSTPASTPRREPPRPQRTESGAAEGLSKMRQAIARRMTLSKQTQPHYYLTLDTDMTAALAFREQFNASATDEQRVSINDLVVKACAIALERHPKFNAEFSEEGLVHHDRVNVCIGVALDDGLIAPALLDCQSKSLGRIAVESKDLINRAKTGSLKADEYSDGTFTITNLGAFGVETLIGIINPPQAAILGVGSVMPQPAVRNGQVAVRQVMNVALSADHRVSDGAEGARFIKEIQALLEGPAALAL
jgi:pyruvate dehydrogenase E2 component (dihydrolipoamide acetyltransferase)